MAIFTLLIAFISIPISAYGALPTTIIKSCYDGDTCTTIYGEKLRLACIDTPELKGKKAEPIAAKEARDFLNALVMNKKVYIKRITKDRYKRTVAELFINDFNIQEIIVKKGYGKIYQKYANQCSWSKWKRFDIYFLLLLNLTNRQNI